MKAFMMIMLMTTTFAAFARYTPDPKYCGGKDTCQKGYFWPFTEGTYYARGFGSNCERAQAASEENFMRTFGDKSCGLVSGPHSWYCFQGPRGKIVSWHQCTPGSGGQQPNRPRCVNIGGRLVCPR